MASSAPLPPTERFSTRVENYLRYRPGYPHDIVALLAQECSLRPEHSIADIASGTGIFTRLLLENGNRVFGVEPNPAMRQAGEAFLRSYSLFISVAGTAEATTLPDGSVDLVTAAQAAHWFDREKTRREFARILRPGGWVALVWNERSTEATAFLREYEQLLLAYGTDYREVRHERTTTTIETFFAPSPCQSRVFPYRQELDYEALEGRLLSSSYTPEPGDSRHEVMLRELRRVFDSHQTGGRVAVEYNTRVFCGRLVE